jgi:hypothetical protein
MKTIMDILTMTFVAIVMLGLASGVAFAAHFGGGGTFHGGGWHGGGLHNHFGINFGIGIAPWGWYAPAPYYYSPYYGSPYYTAPNGCYYDASLGAWVCPRPW